MKEVKMKDDIWTKERKVSYCGVYRTLYKLYAPLAEKTNVFYIENMCCLMYCMLLM